MKSMLERLSVADFHAAVDRLEFLREAARIDTVQDSNDRTAMVDAINWCYDLLCDGATPASIRDRIRVGDDSTLLTLPRVHLLTGHAGKGQQFDWVVVVGMEEGTLPDFRQMVTSEEIAVEGRILSVMISRARHGVVLTVSRTVPTKNGSLRPREASQFWDHLSQGDWIDQAAIDDWLKKADWPAFDRR